MTCYCLNVRIPNTYELSCLIYTSKTITMNIDDEAKVGQN